MKNKKFIKLISYNDNRLYTVRKKHISYYVRSLNSESTAVVLMGTTTISVKETVEEIDKLLEV